MSRIRLTPEQQIRQRYAWFQEAARVGSVSLACKRLGVSRKTFSKWRTRFQVEQGRREALRRRLRALRQRPPLGPARLRALLLARGVRPVPSAATIARVLQRAGLTRRHRRRPTRYRRVSVVPRPGDLVQLDVKWVPSPVAGRQLSQDTAIDGCPRLRVGQLHEDLSLAAAKAFAPYVLSTSPFPVRCVQTDNDAIFTHGYTAGPKTPLERPVEAHPLTRMCEQLGAPHRLLPPRPPRLNGRVERSPQTDEQEVSGLRRYPTRRELQRAFRRWLWHSNHTRLHTGAGRRGRTPLQVLRPFAEYRDVKHLRCYPC